jgi:hypothetical protein
MHNTFRKKRFMLLFATFVCLMATPPGGYPPPACESCDCFESDLIFIGDQDDGSFRGYRIIFEDFSTMEVLHAFYPELGIQNNKADVCNPPYPYQHEINNFGLYPYNEGTVTCSVSNAGRYKAERNSNSQHSPKIGTKRSRELCDGGGP